jgi:hypothetical protein
MTVLDPGRSPGRPEGVSLPMNVIRVTGSRVLVGRAPLLAVVLWGGIYPTAKLSLYEIPLLTFMSLRMVLATVVFLVFG